MTKWLAIVEIALRVIAAVVEALGSAGALPARAAANKIAKARASRSTDDQA